MTDNLSEPRSSIDALHAYTPEECSLVEAASLLMRLHGRAISPRALASSLPREDTTVELSHLLKAMEEYDFVTRVSRRPVKQIPALALPAILILKDRHACVLTALHEDGSATVLMPESGLNPQVVSAETLTERYAGWVLFARPSGKIKDPPKTDEDAVSYDPSKGSTAWLWNVLWRYRSYYTETGIAAVLVNLLGLAISLFVMNVYDRVVPNRAFETLWVLTIGVTLAIVLEFSLRMLRGYFVDTAAKKADLIVSSHLFKHVMGIRLEYRPKSVGNFAAQIREFESIRDFITSAALVVLSDLPFAFLYVGFIGMLGGPLAFVTLATLPVVIITGLIIQVPLSAAVEEMIHDGCYKQGVLVEALDGLEALRACGGERFFRGKWEHACAATARTSNSVRIWSALAMNANQLVTQVATVVMIVCGVYLIADGKMTQGGLIGCMMLLGRALAPLTQVTGILSRYQQAKTSYKSLQKLMALPPERDVNRTYLDRPKFDGGIVLKEVQFSYGSDKSKNTLEIPHLEIKPGEKVAILGQVGSGKSTMLKLIGAMYHPQKGMLMFDGIDLQQLDPADVRLNVAIVPQEARLFLGTLRENLTLSAPDVDTNAMMEVAILCGVHKWAMNHPLGYDMPIGEGGIGLSGGQRQMVTLGRALLTNAPIMLLDEPTSSLDQGTEQVLIEHLKHQFADATVVLVTHRPSILALVSRVIVMDAGRIVADGPRDVILKMLSTPSKETS